MRTLFVAAVLVAASAGTAWRRMSPRARIRSRSACPAIRSATTRRTRSARCSTASTAASPAPSPDFNYSDANKNSGITWNEANFKEYIKDPRAKVPGTKMVFAGIKNEKEIDDLWAYVSQFNADGSIKKK